MAKTSGLGWPTLSIDDAAGTPRDLRNDHTNFSLATPRAVFDWTGIDKSAFERSLGLADASLQLNGVFNPAANLSHSVLRTVSSTTVLRTVSLAIASQTLGMEMLPTDYSLNRATDGNFTFTAPFVLADGTVPTWGP